MDKENIFRKIIGWEELSKEERIKASEWLVPKTDFLPLNEISAQEKIEIARELVAQNVAALLEKEIIIAKLSWRKADLKLSAKVCRDSDENIRKFLAILWAKEINVSSDFPWYCESYEWQTFIKFSF